MLALAAAAALALTGCGATTDTPPPTGTSDAECTNQVGLDEIPEIASIWWQQSQPLPGFDYAAYETSDAGDIADLRQVLADHGVTGDFRFEHPDCEGGLTTWVRYTTDAGDEVELTTNSCEGVTPFEADLNELVSGWREG